MMRILVLGLGNDLLGDDAVGLLAARALAAELHGDADVDVVESAVSGLALLDHLVGYDRALLLDAVQTGRCPEGSVLEIDPRDLGRVVAPSPHYAGLPEIFELASRLELQFPSEVRILAVEIAAPSTIALELSPPVRAAVGELAARGRRQVEAWRDAGG
jgi:hydrogenase maturation protease